MLTYIYSENKVWVTLTKYPKVWNSSMNQSSCKRENEFVKHSSLWHTFIMRSKIASHMLFFPNPDIYILLHIFWGKMLHHTDLLSRSMMFIYLFFLFGFYGLSRLFHSFWVKSIIRWGKNGRSPRKNTWPKVRRTWPDSHVTRDSLEPTAVRWWAIYSP